MNRCGDGCGLEYQLTDLSWRRLPSLAPVAPFMVTRPAKHDWEKIPAVLPPLPEYAAAPSRR